MSLINQETFVCFDLETTGLDPEADRVIEVAAARFTFDKIIDTYETLIDPECPISETSMAIHHITDQMVEGKPKIQDILSSLFAFIGKEILIGHGIGLDIAFLAAAAKRHQVHCHLQTLPFIDTLRMARLYGESPTNSLEMLREHFNIPSEGAHRAMSDVLVNMEVFKYLSAKFSSSAQIFERLKKPIALKVMPLGKYKGRPFSEIPNEYLFWASKADFDQDLLFSVHNELKKRKKAKPFNQAGNPFLEL
jgi:DNA polymerase III subunit epsilon